MQTTTNSIRNLKIDGMNGDTCIKKVTHALKDVKGIITKSVKIGSASIDANKEGSDAACKAVSAVGFKTHESKTAKDSVAETLKVNSGLNKKTPAAQAAAKKN